MPSIRFTASIVIAAAGSLALTACGTQTASSTSTTPVGSQVSASPARQPTEKQFLDILTKFARQCSPTPPAAAAPHQIPGHCPAASPAVQPPHRQARRDT